MTRLAPLAPLFVLCFVLACATTLAMVGRLEPSTLDKLLLLVTGAALGALQPTVAGPLARVPSVPPPPRKD
jgi:hypothetical protein